MRSHIETRSEISADKKSLICVLFEREGPEANTPTIEAVFQVHRPDSYDLTNLKPPVLVLLSVTQTDTRKPAILAPDEEIEVYQLASDCASESMG